MQHAQREGAASTAVVAMLDKVARREVDVDIAYTGFSCPDEFVVGCVPLQSPDWGVEPVCLFPTPLSCAKR